VGRPATECSRGAIEARQSAQRIASIPAGLAIRRLAAQPIELRDLGLGELTRQPVRIASIEPQQGKRFLQVTIEAEGPDRIIVRRARRNIDEALGVIDGLFEPNYLENLRREERA
jgi:hypothetical protein